MGDAKVRRVISLGWVPAKGMLAMGSLREVDHSQGTVLSSQLLIHVPAAEDSWDYWPQKLSCADCVCGLCQHCRMGPKRCPSGSRMRSSSNQNNITRFKLQIQLFKLN